MLGLATHSQAIHQSYAGRDIPTTGQGRVQTVTSLSHGSTSRALPVVTRPAVVSAFHLFCPGLAHVAPSAPAGSRLPSQVWLQVLAGAGGGLGPSCPVHQCVVNSSRQSLTPRRSPIVLYMNLAVDSRGAGPRCLSVCIVWTWLSTQGDIAEADGFNVTWTGSSIP
jgi:hypothetical protein